MEIYLFRHGIAEEGKPGHPDAARRLTEEGIKRTAAVIKLARHGGVEPSLIMSSPYLRAVETAQIAAEGLGYKGEIVHADALVPHGTPEKVWNELRDHRTESAIFMAGHEPLLGRLVSYLLSAPALRIEMKKAAMVRLDVEGFGLTPHGTLRWMITPKLA